MREDRNMELSIRRKRQSDGEGVRTERENWEGEWVMGLKGAEGDTRIKVKKEKTAGKICSNDLNCLQIYVLFCVSLYINPSGCGDSTNVTPVRLCVRVCVYCGTLLFFLCMQFMPPPKQTDFWVLQKVLACGEATSTHIQTPFPPQSLPTLLVLVERKEV